MTQALTGLWACSATNLYNPLFENVKSFNAIQVDSLHNQAAFCSDVMTDLQ